MDFLCINTQKHRARGVCTPVHKDIWNDILFQMLRIG